MSRTPPVFHPVYISYCGLQLNSYKDRAGNIFLRLADTSFLTHNLPKFRKLSQSIRSD